MWHVTHGGGWSFSQHSSSLALMAWNFFMFLFFGFMTSSRFVGKLWLNWWPNDKAVGRTAPATPDLLNRPDFLFSWSICHILNVEKPLMPTPPTPSHLGMSINFSELFDLFECVVLAMDPEHPEHPLRTAVAGKAKILSRQKKHNISESLKKPWRKTYYQSKLTEKKSY